MDFTGRRIAVTGAAGGLGGAIARALQPTARPSWEWICRRPGAVAPRSHR